MISLKQLVKELKLTEDMPIHMSKKPFVNLKLLKEKGIDND